MATVYLQRLWDNGIQTHKNTGWNKTLVIGALWPDNSYLKTNKKWNSQLKEQYSTISYLSGGLGIQSVASRDLRVAPPPSATSFWTSDSFFSKSITFRWSLITDIHFFSRAKSLSEPACLWWERERKREREKRGERGEKTRGRDIMFKWPHTVDKKCLRHLLLSQSIPESLRSLVTSNTRQWQYFCDVKKTHTSA